MTTVTALETQIATLAEQVAALEASAAEADSARDFLWLVVCGALVMFMQPGFAMLECGTVRAKSAVTVLLKNMVDVTLGTLMWFFIGYGFAYGATEGGTPNKFMGIGNFFGNGFVDEAKEYPLSNIVSRDWFFQWAFCATAATIVSGGVAERIRFPVYIFFSAIMTGIIYPIVVWWTWSGNGWLTLFWGDDSDKSGYTDFAGSGIVHLTGGIAALAGSALCGPRPGRFDNPENFEAHNVGFVVLGTFILWFGWYGFNCGSTLGFSGSAAGQAAHVAVNTTVSAAGGGLMVFVLRLRGKTYDIGGMCNGILAGLVAVCAGVGDFEPFVAMIVGMLGGAAQEACHVLLIKLKIDDPIDAVGVHGAAGIMGALAFPLLMIGGPDMDMFIANLVGIIAIMAWSGGLTAATLAPFKVMGKLVYTEEEMDGGSDQHMTPTKMYTGTDAK